MTTVYMRDRSIFDDCAALLHDDVRSAVMMTQLCNNTSYMAAAGHEPGLCLDTIFSPFDERVVENDKRRRRRKAAKAARKRRVKHLLSNIRTLLDGSCLDDDEAVLDHLLKRLQGLNGYYCYLKRQQNFWGCKV